MKSLQLFRTKPHSWEGCSPPEMTERLAAFRDELTRQPDYAPEIHVAKIVRGVTWLEEFKRRPIPKHRALALIEGSAGKRRVRVNA